MGAEQQTAAGVTNLITASSIGTDGFIYGPVIDGVAIVPSGGADVSIQFSVSAGAGAVRAGGYCVFQ
jgi:hypothetical protein